MATSQGTLLDQLNEPQRVAATHGRGPLLILAGAGSGKTRTITYRIAYLIEQGLCPADRILAVTFTNKAAEEMRKRVAEIAGAPRKPPLICTFHSLGVRLLRRHAELLGYGRDFTICDSDDQRRILKRVYKNLGLIESEIPVRRAASVISRAKNDAWPPEEYEARSRDRDAPVLAKIYRDYQDYLRISNATDFDDLILLTLRLLSEHAEIGERYGNWYQQILIDEYQDTNRPQYELIQALTAFHQNLCAVGDEDQSIYGFRGADIDNILRFEQDFPGTSVIRLEQNYRSTQVILDGAGAVVSNNVQRKGKTLWTADKGGSQIEIFTAADPRDEAEYVGQRIVRYLGEGHRHFAILYRTNFQSREFEEILNREQIRYRIVGGVGFYARKEIRDVLAYIRLARNTSDNVSLLRIINTPTRGIGAKTVQTLQGWSEESEGRIWDSLVRALGDAAFPGRAHRALQRFREIIDRCRSYLERPLPILIEQVLEATDYLEALRREGSEESENRILNLQELVNVAREAEQADIDLQEFLDQISLRSDADDYDEAAPVTLMTLHNAKGLEFPVVFIVGCEEGLFPHSRAILEDDLEEERRLCYVGMTRAEKRLHLSHSKRRRLYGSGPSESNLPSQFLMEIPPDLTTELTSPRVQRYSGPGFPQPHVPFQKPKRQFPGKTYDTKDSVRQFLDSIPAQEKSAGKIVRGATVVHAEFGPGKVLHVEKTGKDLKVTVRFPGIGIKKMLQSYAKMRPV